MENKNRELKFRVWNGSKMEYDITVGRFGAFYVNPENGDGLNPYDAASLTTCTTKYFDETPVMQYTGIKLKGKEIYEGDILGGYPHGSVWVEWNNEAATWSAKWNETHYDEDGAPVIIERHSMLFNEIEDCKDKWEVIGNIYQNPELLNA